MILLLQTLWGKNGQQLHNQLQVSQNKKWASTEKTSALVMINVVFLLTLSDLIITDTEGRDIPPF